MKKHHHNAPSLFLSRVSDARHTLSMIAKSSQIRPLVTFARHLYNHKVYTEYGSRDDAVAHLGYFLLAMMTNRFVDPSYPYNRLCLSQKVLFLEHLLVLVLLFERSLF